APLRRPGLQPPAAIQPGRSDRQNPGPAHQGQQGSLARRQSGITARGGSTRRTRRGAYFMRVRAQNKETSVHAIAGTEVDWLGLDVATRLARKLLGLAIGRSEGKTDHGLAGGRTFQGAAPANGKRTDSRSAPIQAFLWGDYETKPGTTYTYTVTAKYGSP